MSRDSATAAEIVRERERETERERERERERVLQQMKWKEQTL
jgi:hypothetical protein